MQAVSLGKREKQQQNKMCRGKGRIREIHTLVSNVGGILFLSLFLLAIYVNNRASWKKHLGKGERQHYCQASPKSHPQPAHNWTLQ